MSESYQPISCILHEQLEMAAIRGKPVCLQLRDGRALPGVVEDVWTEKGAEYLRLRRGDEQRTLRLDLLAGLEETG